jgi:hypothetical protein
MQLYGTFTDRSTRFVNLFVAAGNAEQDGVIYAGSENVCYQNLLLLGWFLCCCEETILSKVFCSYFTLRRRYLPNC